MEFEVHGLMTIRVSMQMGEIANSMIKRLQGQHEEG